MSYSVSVTRSGGGAVVVTRSDSGVKVVEANNVGTLVSVAQAAAASADEDAAAAAASALAASGSASAAASSATDAQTAQTAAELAETHAETAETNAETAQGLAEAAQAAAEAAQGAAEAAQVAAETAETNAETAETAAETAQGLAEAAQAAAEAAAASITLPLPIASGGLGVALSDPGADRLMFWDDSGGTVDWLALGDGLKITTTTASVDIDGLTLKTTPAVSDELMLADASASFGLKKITADRFMKIINGLTEDTSPDSANDFIPTWDASASVAKKVKPGSLSIATTQLSGTLAAGQFPALTGDVTTVAGALATTIGAAKVTRAMLANGVANSVIGRAANSSGVPADIQATVGGTVLRLSGTTLGFGTLAAGAFATGPGIVTPAMLDNGSARSVLGVTGNSAAARADMQATAYQVLRGNSAGTAVAFGAIDLSQSAAATGVIQAASFPAMTGDVTSVAGALATTIAADAVTNSKLANVATSTIKGRATASTGDPEDLTASQVRTILGMGDAYALNKASASNILTGTASVMSPDVLETALAYSAVTSATTINTDLSTARRYTLTQAHNITLANPSNMRAGQDVFIVFTQDGTGSRLLSAVGSAWKFPGGIPTFSTAAGAVDAIGGLVQANGTIRANFFKAYS